MKDGMERQELNVSHFATSGSITAEAISGNTLAVGTGVVDSAEIGADAVGTSEQAFIGIGSPPAYVSRMLHGSGAMTAATSLWVVFGDTFGAVPNVTLGCDVAGDVGVAAAAPGSFLASGTNATIFHWMAAGSA